MTTNKKQILTVHLGAADAERLAALMGKIQGVPRHGLIVAALRHAFDHLETLDDYALLRVVLASKREPEARAVA